MVRADQLSKYLHNRIEPSLTCQATFASKIGVEARQVIYVIHEGPIDRQWKRKWHAKMLIKDAKRVTQICNVGVIFVVGSLVPMDETIVFSKADLLYVT